MIEKVLYYLGQVGILLIAFCDPFFLNMIHVVIFLTFLDLITAIIKDHHLRKIGEIEKKGWLIKSHKLRRATIKLFLYIIFMLSIFVVLKYTYPVWWILKVLFIMIALQEIVSIGENASIVTGKMVFINFTKKLTKKVTDEINKWFGEKDL